MSASVDVTERLELATAGRYRMARELGRGGMATVYLARDEVNDRMVAIKVLHPELTAAVTLERFLREIKLLATLQHPHILPLYDSGAADGMLYYVMPYVAGESLRDRLEREGRLPLPLALRIADETAAALDYAHRQGVIHRDIKPENILLSDQHVLVADFGIARAAVQSTNDRLTITSLVVGTPAYMSPEQASADGDLDGRSDIYSLGCVLFEMLTGAKPFAGTSAAGSIAARFTTAPPRVSARRAGVPAHVEAAVAAAMTLAPDGRPATAAAFAERLHDARFVGSSRSRRRAIARVATGLLVVAAAGVALWTQWRRPANTAMSIAVLPFEVEGGSPGEQYLGEGVADELTDALGGIPGLRVAARTAAFAFGSRPADIRDVGRRLNVRILIGGYVRPRGRSMLITAELTEAGTGARIKSVAVDRDTTDPLGVQGRLARAIAGALALRLTPSDSARLVKRQTVDPEAHDSYLRGRYFFDRLEAGAYKQALAQFRAAIARDSQYAQAWTGLADVYAALGVGNATPGPPRATFEQARQAAQRALAIDSTISDAHAALALVQMMYDYDWSAATRSLDRAHALDPSNEEAYLYRTFLLLWLGRSDEAVAQGDTALRLDPTLQRHARGVGLALIQARRYRDAEHVLNGAVQLDSTRGQVTMLLGEVRLAMGRPRVALNDLDGAARLMPASTRAVAFRVAALSAVGSRAEATRLVDSLHAAANRRFVPAMDLALAHMGLGDRAGALTWFERAQEERTLRPFVRDPIFDPIRNEPRYVALLAALRLPR